MKKILFIALLGTLLFFACKPTAETIPSLELVWETDTLMTTSESAVYDSVSGLIYVSNINFGPWDFDHNGFISTINTEGEIVERYCLQDSLSAPKGMGLFDNHLYINDNNQIVVADLASRQIIEKHTVEGEVQLNDITIDQKGQVYSSDSHKGNIYMLKNGEVKHYTQLDSMARLNGLYAMNDRLYFTYFKINKFGQLYHKDQTSELLSDSIGLADGIVQLETGHFITSSWDGKLYYINANTWQQTLILDVSKEKVNTADLCYIPQKQLLIVPTFYHNTVRAYKISY